MSGEPQYISLTQASQYCDYSQEYLSLRARQKKLQAKKIGRNWFTTRKWLQEYTALAANYKDNLAQKPHTSRAQPMRQTTRIPNFPPASLPVSSSPLFKFRSQAAIDRYRYLMSLERRIGIGFSLIVFVLAFSLSVFAWQGEIFHVAQGVNRSAHSVSKEFDEGFTLAGRLALSELEEMTEKMGTEYLASVGSIAQAYVTWVKTAITSFGNAVVHLIKG